MTLHVTDQVAHCSPCPCICVWVRENVFAALTNPVWVFHLVFPLCSRPIWLDFLAVVRPPILALGGVQLPLPVLQWPERAERT